MEVSIDNSNISECNMIKEPIKHNVIHDMRDCNPGEENVEALKALQKIILLYEGRHLSLDQVLARVIEFYGEFVQYK